LSEKRILETFAQNDKFCQLGDFMKYSHSKAMAVCHKIVKLVKNGVLMIIHIYAKVSNILFSDKHQLRLLRRFGISGKGRRFWFERQIR
jgi:hypothetical protein